MSNNDADRAKLVSELDKIARARLAEVVIGHNLKVDITALGEILTACLRTADAVVMSSPLQAHNIDVPSFVLELGGLMFNKVVRTGQEQQPAQVVMMPMEGPAQEHRGIFPGLPSWLKEI